MATSFPIDRFLHIQSAGRPTFSPDGRFVGFITNITGVNQLWQVPIEGGWPTQLTFFNESVRGASYSPRQHEIVFSMDAGGNERAQLFKLEGVGGGTDHAVGEGWIINNLTRHPKAVHYFGGWSHDGESIAFSANREDPGRFDIYVQRVAGKKSKASKARLVAKGPGGYYFPAGWSRNDKSLLVYRPESNFNQNLYVVNIATGKTTHLTPHKGNAQYESPAWAPDGKAVYCVSTHGGHDKSGLARIDLDGGKVTYLYQKDHEIESIEVAPKSGGLAFLVNIDGKSELHTHHLGGGQNFPPPKLPVGVVSSLEYSRDGTKLAYVLDGPRHNADVWIYDLLNRKTKQLTQSSRAGIPFGQMVEPELIHYPTFDGKKIPAWFYKPEAKGGRLPPVIVYPHGGPESQYRPRFSAIFQYFLQNGFAVLAPNVRGSSGYGTAYMNLDNTTNRMSSVKDLAHAAFWLRDQKQGDPKRLAVFGGSYGGFMVLAQVVYYPQLWAAGIDVVGICNFVTFLERTGAYRRSHRENEYGSLKKDREFLAKISPINHVDKIKCPMMVIHGANDPRVPIHEAEQIVAALKKRKIPVEYLRFEDEGHGLAKLKNRLDAYPKMVSFLDKYVKNK